MAQKTALTAYGLPGRAQSFTAKPLVSGGHSPGWITELGVGGWPGGKHSFLPKGEVGGAHPAGHITTLAAYGVSGRLHNFLAKTPVVKAEIDLFFSTGTAQRMFFRQPPMPEFKSW